MNLNSCRECKHQVSENAPICPNCGAPKPADSAWNGWGYEWKSAAAVFGLPLVHIAVGRDGKNRWRIAHGIIAIGQFAVGGITIAQFGAGIIALTQFGIGALIVSQFALGAVCIAQFGVALSGGLAQFLITLNGMGF